MEKKLSKKSGIIILLAIALYLLFSGKTTASLANEKFSVPAQYGMIKESFQTENTEQNTGRTIIHIQDAHCNYEAQKNMTGLLEYLVKEHNLKLIMLEGGSGNVSLSFLRSYSDKKARQEVAEKYLKAGKISGEEYLDIVSDYPIELYGVEDEALYDAHMSSFRKVDSIKEKGLRDLEGLSRAVENLKPFIYSEELRRLEDKKKKYEEKGITLAQYCQFLEQAARSKNLGQKEYAHIVAFCETSRLEKEIDFTQAEAQRNAFIKDLAKLLDKGAVNGLVNKTQEFKEKSITQEEYYSYLKDMAGEKFSLKDDYPELAAYIRYVAVSKDVNAPDLLKEISAIEEKIKEGCFQNDDQRKLSEISKSIQILTRILNLELTPEDYAYFQANKPRFTISLWVDFLTKECKTYNLQSEPAASSAIDGNFEHLEAFYQLGVEREQAFIKNAVNKMDESGEKLAVLITGGFHTPGVTRLLKEKGYSYEVVAPLITQKGDSSIYLRALKKSKNRQSSLDYND